MGAFQRAQIPPQGVCLGLRGGIIGGCFHNLQPFPVASGLELIVFVCLFLCCAVDSCNKQF